ncbi:hypothetical protein SAMN05216312_102418 [Cohnella sp. OV330]|uniref:hypothetical protein n=1 Tax=Cohnella sp. OV330 TaxID=1855288 RepID=UPI0008E2BF47|nr:hypothetical protein [Cohnella sp. OV330]SFA94386.1 hypothetical protein SAMN05216312_102418 [Cohnella sp. OV330]
MLAFSRQFAPLILAGCILFAGAMTSAYAFFTGFHNREYVALNAKTVVHLQPGEYEIFYDYIDDKNESGPRSLMPSHPSGRMLDLVTAMVDDGRSSLDLAEDSSDVYALKRVKGKSVYRFTVEQKGTYGITLISNAADLQGQVRFAVMSDFIRVLVSALKKWGLFFAAAAPFLLADFVLHMRLEKRKLVKTRLSLQP